MTHLIGKFCAVEISATAYELRITGAGLEYRLTEGTWQVIILPPGSYTLFCISDSATEEQAGEIVDSWENESMFGDLSKWYEDYTSKYEHFLTAIESLTSLFKSKGLNKRYAILKRN